MIQEQVLKEKSLIQTEDQNYTIPSLAELEHKPRHYQKLIYNYCKENYPGLIKIAKVFRDHTRENFDNHVSVEGGTGSGKSAWTFLIVHIIHEMLGNTFNIERQCLFIPNEGELKNKMHSLKQYEVFWLDEAIRALDKKRWWDADQIDMNHIVKTERWRNNTVFYNIQRFAELTETFRNDNIYFRIFIVKKFASILYVKDEDKDIEDPWHIKNNLSIKYKNNYGATRYTAIMTPMERLAREKKLPNYFMDSQYPDPCAIPGIKEYWLLYERLKKHSREMAKQKGELKKSTKTNKYDMKYKTELAKIVQKHAEEGKGKAQIKRELNIDLPITTFNSLFEVDHTPQSGNNNSINNSILKSRLDLKT